MTLFEPNGAWAYPSFQHGSCSWRRSLLRVLFVVTVVVGRGEGCLFLPPGQVAMQPGVFSCVCLALLEHRVSHGIQLKCIEP